MAQEYPIEIVCPRCGRGDEVQPVKQVVAAGGAAVPAYVAAATTLQREQPDMHRLAERLRYGGNLASQEIGAIPAGCTVALGAALPLAVVGAGLLLALLLDRWGYARAVSLPIGGLVVLAGIMGVLNMLRQLPGFTRKAHEDRDAYLEAKEKDETAFARWQNDLHYCFRDDCVFLCGQPHAVPPEQMYVLLYA
jgi:hypothetical protein